jgi:hypothetical protein
MTKQKEDIIFFNLIIIQRTLSGDFVRRDSREET